MPNSSFGNNFLPFENTASPFIPVNKAVLTYALNLLFTSLWERCCQSPQELLAKGWCNPYEAASLPFHWSWNCFPVSSRKIWKSSFSPLYTDAPILPEVNPPSLKGGITSGRIVCCGFNERSQNSSIKFGRISFLVSVASGTSTWNRFPNWDFMTTLWKHNCNNIYTL